MLQIQAHDAILRRHGEGFETSPAPNRNGSYEDHVMASKALPSPEVLRQLLRYEPDTGKLFWLPRAAETFVTNDPRGRNWVCSCWNARRAGRQAFTAVSSDGYRMGIVLGVGVLAHRAIWAIQTGKWSDRQIDHADMDPGNNRWGNLREATRSENMRNKGLSCNNTSGVKGVSWHKGSGVWRARLTLHRKQYYLGGFRSLESAARAIESHRAIMHGEFARQK